jgi:two-component system cell cycle response regulator
MRVLEGLVPVDELDEAMERTVVFERSDVLDAVSPKASNRLHVLVRMDGSDVGQVTALEGQSLEVGRAAKCAVHLPFEGVSRQHASLTWKDGSYWVEDSASANGTFVQGTRITHHKLSDGDVVQFGPRVVFRYSVTDTSEEKILRQLYESSVKDSLTGAYNREYFSERLKTEIAYARRHQTEVSLFMVDVDHFKKVNDTYGHPAGDAVLVNAVETLGKTLRGEDVVARYGGEEFTVILRGISLPNAIIAAERLRALVEAAEVIQDGHSIRCTVSVGVASLSCTDTSTEAALIAVADRRLYLAKRGGRNRVVGIG